MDSVGTNVSSNNIFTMYGIYSEKCVTILTPEKKTHHTAMSCTVYSVDRQITYYYTIMWASIYPA